MKAFLIHLKWQFMLLQKNNIITISFVVTLIYGIILFFLKDVGNLDKFIVAIVLNDPSVIGYFFVALSIFTEIKSQVLSAIRISPVNIHQLLLAKIVSLSIIGTVCAIGLAISVKGLDFHIINYTIGAFGVCAISTMLGLIMMKYSSEFLRFVMFSIPIFIAIVNIPLMHYLGAFDLGFFNYLFPVQGCINLIDMALSGTKVPLIYSYSSLVVFLPIFYFLSFRVFSKNIINK